MSTYTSDWREKNQWWFTEWTLSIPRVKILTWYSQELLPCSPVYSGGRWAV